MSPSIFVSIAAYREFDLVNTLRDCFAQAADPERLRVCICWQHEASESLQEFEADPRVDIIDVPYQESRGVCWARHEIQRRYDGSPYTLQIDGHHRFAPGWDAQLIDMIEQLRHKGVAKPILTGYVPGYDPWNDPAGRVRDVWGLGIDRFEGGGVVFMRPFVLPADLTEPVPCRFWSAHFSFTIGRFNEEVLIDPHGYFHGEEIVTCARAYTHGYDLFTPHRTLLWHEYSRKGRICHWNDHADWGLRNTRAINRYRRHLGVDGTVREDQSPYDLGSERSLTDYERYAGIEFATRGVQRRTVANAIPPDPLQHASDEQWRAELLISHCADVWIERARLEFDDLNMWGIFANAADGTELHREDYLRDRYSPILTSQSGDHIGFFISFFDQRRPDRWTVWPHSLQRGWLPRVDGAWPRPAPTPPTDPR
ncbi:MAG: GlcNAc-transferase family protein [Deltaproteobacteria bacterium]|nr:GlcNAc-transferase family protein [Deltaproteobacteria bacterium]